MPATSFQSTTRDGAERAGEERRGQVGAAAAEGRDRAVRARAEEAGHDRGDPALQERREEPPRVPARGGEVGGGGAVAAVGRHDLGRVHARGPAARGVEGRRHDRARGALPAGDERVARPVGEVGERGHRVGDLAVLAGLRVGGGEQACAARLPAGRGRARGRGDGGGTWRRRTEAASGSPATERRAPSRRRSVTPARAETTTTSGPRWARTSATAWRTAAASASDAPPNFQTSSRGRRRFGARFRGISAPHRWHQSHEQG